MIDNIEELKKKKIILLLKKKDLLYYYIHIIAEKYLIIYIDINL